MFAGHTRVAHERMLVIDSNIKRSSMSRESSMRISVRLFNSSATNAHVLSLPMSIQHKVLKVLYVLFELRIMLAFLSSVEILLLLDS